MAALYPHRQVFASDLIVQINFDWRHALHLGCVESVSTHYVTQPGPLSVTLNWNLVSNEKEEDGAARNEEPAMSVPAVRGSPYATMEYRGVSPVVSARQVRKIDFLAHSLMATSSHIVLLLLSCMW